MNQSTRYEHRPKHLPDGRAMLNIGCGTRMDRSWTNLDFSPYATLARRPLLAKLLTIAGALSPERRERLAAIDPQIVRHDLRYGIPFEDETFDVVYHSHFLEHLHPSDGQSMLRECRRVLRPGGTIRIVVPDLERIAKRYMAALSALDAGTDNQSTRDHENAIADLFDQMVRREATGAKEQRGIMRTVEGILRGDPGKTGELHRWMYDRRSLAAVLTRIGFTNPGVESAESSRIAGWKEFQLDTLPGGTSYKPGSLYMEASKGDPTD